MRKHPVISLDEKMRLRVNSYLYLLSDKINKTDSDTYSPYVCGNLIHALFAELSAAILALAKEYSTTRSERRESIYRDFMMILSTLPVRPRIVKWYAEQLCVSPKYLSEICKTQSGRSATEWIKEYAIMDINRMMTTTDLSIKQIAFELKYPNLPFFGKCVRRWFGLSPTEIHNKLRSG